MALVCLKVWGLNFLVCREMHVVVAVVAWRLTRCSIASRLSLFPVRVGNSGSVGLPFRSVIQTRSTFSVFLVSGTLRCLRPLPSQRTWAPPPRLASLQFRLVSSDTRSPVCMARSIRARSRLPSHVVRSGAARIAALSVSVRNETVGFTYRFGGIASTCAMVAPCSGCRSAA